MVLDPPPWPNWIAAFYPSATFLDVPCVRAVRSELNAQLDDLMALPARVEIQLPAFPRRRFLVIGHDANCDEVDDPVILVKELKTHRYFYLRVWDVNVIWN